jgi:hypothetical protein
MQHSEKDPRDLMIGAKSCCTLASCTRIRCRWLYSLVGRREPWDFYFKVS